MPKAMGKVPTAAATAGMKRKKKGRPSKSPLPFSSPTKPTPSNSTNRRSRRRNPNLFNSPPQPDFDDDEDERKEKKVKLVVRLPQLDEKGKVGEKHQRQRDRRHSRESDSGSGSGSGSDSDPESENREGCARKRKIDNVDRGSDEAVLDQDKEVVKATETPINGSPLESGPTTPLPDKKLLVFILDRLQKKDTYGVFSEPVDPNELPDYFDVIEHPMDFGTVRKKLDNGTYKNLEELEADVFLICSNAMQYNASDTIYYRQARSIQELAKRDFENLKHEGDDGKPQPKVVRRGRPPSNKKQKSHETSPVDHAENVGTEVSSGATLANGEDKATGSNSYNLRKGSALFRVRPSDPFVSSNRSRNGENCSESLADWNNEFPASILRADMKYGKKQFTVDENKRDTYRQSLSLGNSSPILSNSFGNMKRLVPVGLQEAFSYARSLARYAANLGPVAWKIASKKIGAVLPAGVEYGPGWVGENGASSQLLLKSTNSTAGDSNSSKLMRPSASDLSSAVAHRPSEGVVEAVRKLNSENELAGQNDASSWRTQFPVQQNSVQHSYRNGFSGMVGYDFSAAGAARVSMQGNFMTDGVSVPSQVVETIPRNDPSLSHSSAPTYAIPEQGKSPESRNNLSPGYQMAQGKAPISHGEAEVWNMGKSRQVMAVQQRHNNPSAPPDLNVRVPVGSPSSSLQIGSPKQPDLALQL